MASSDSSSQNEVSRTRRQGGELTNSMSQAERVLRKRRYGTLTHVPQVKLFASKVRFPNSQMVRVTGTHSASTLSGNRCTSFRSAAGWADTVVATKNISDAHRNNCSSRQSVIEVCALTVPHNFDVY